MIGVILLCDASGKAMILKTIIGSRPWYAYAADGRGENFKTRKEAIAWLATQRDAPIASHGGGAT